MHETGHRWSNAGSGEIAAPPLLSCMDTVVYSQQHLAGISGRWLITGLFPVTSRFHDLKSVQVNRWSRRFKQRCGPGQEINESIRRMQSPPSSPLTYTGGAKGSSIYPFLIPARKISAPISRPVPSPISYTTIFDLHTLLQHLSNVESELSL